jgi:hypothetical protein
MTTSDPNNSRAEAAAAKAYSRAQRPWVARHKILTALAAFVVLGVIVSATGGGSKKADTSASDPLTSSAPAAAAAPAETTAPVAAAPAADTGKPNDKGWVVQSLRTKDDGLGDFGGSARITNTNDSSKTGTFTITLSTGGKVIATLQGSASGTSSGQTVSVDLISQDKYSAAAYTYDFQTDVSY